MGYYTDYEMTPARHNPESLSEDTYLAIGAFIADTRGEEGWSYLYDAWVGNAVNITWYDHEKDMISLSTVFPDVFFTLWGHGEEADDLWKKYYLHGKYQRTLATITYADFDERKLKEFASGRTCPSCCGSGVEDADGLPSIGCRKCWGRGEVFDG